MKVNRRNFLSSTAFLGSSSILPYKTLAKNNYKVNLNPNELRIGVITWSYRSLPSNLYSVIGYCLDSELNAMELMGGSVESYLGIPRRRSLQREWRENISMDKFKIVRKMLDDAGIRVYAYKPSSIGMDNTDKEIENAIQAASILGARSVTLEIFDGIQYKIPDKTKYNEYTQKLGDIGKKYNVFIGWHNHTQAHDALWDNVLNQSEYNSMNFDIGHYIARGKGNTDKTLMKFLKKNHTRITSIHLKDRMVPSNGGYNMEWGKGNTPLLDVIRLAYKKNYNIDFTIELEYPIPTRSNAIREVRKCKNYALKAITS